MCKYDETNGCYTKEKLCSDNKDKTSCESTILYDNDNDIDLDYKCTWKDTCVKEKRLCSDARSIQECSVISPSSSYKECIFIDGSCREQYTRCSAYNSGNEKDSTKCESIMLNDFTKKCYLDQSGTCQEKAIATTCSDFKKDDFASYCPLLSFQDLEKKCTYSNSACTPSPRTCLELSYAPEVSEDICADAPTSDSKGKICSIKADFSGCEEKDSGNKGSFIYDKKTLIFSLLLISFLLL